MSQRKKQFFGCSVAYSTFTKNDVVSIKEMGLSVSL